MRLTGFSLLRVDRREVQRHFLHQAILISGIKAVNLANPIHRERILFHLMALTHLEEILFQLMSLTQLEVIPSQLMPLIHRH